MKKDKLKLYILETLLTAFLFFALFAPNIINRFILSIFLLIISIFTRLILKKRSIDSAYEKQVFIMMLIFAIIYVIAFYASGLYFGYARSKVLLSLWSTYTFIIPISVIIISSEIIRKILLSQNAIINIRGHKINISIVLIFIAMVIIDLLLYTGIYDLTNIDDFLMAIGFVLFASISCNLLYNYLAIRFSPKAIITYRLITTLFLYIIPIIPEMHLFLRSFIRMIYPFIIFMVMEETYSKTNFAIAYKDKKRNIVFTTISLIVLSLLVMLISCRFKYGIIVIGSGSMTGTIDKGDAVLYERYDGANIKKGQVIIFNYGNIKTIHRIVEIRKVNGEIHYYTKGDANKSNDEGYITKNSIIGLVRYKIKYIGKPTLWFRDLFNK